MRRQALESLKSAIEANTERRSIEQLQASGKRHVRVVSSQKVLQIIKAIVSDIVDREVGELSAGERERIVGETKDQFDRVMKMQSEQDKVINEHKSLAEEYRGKYDEATKELSHWRTAAEAASMLKVENERLQRFVEEGKGWKAEADRAAKLSTENERLMQMVEDTRSRGEEREERLKAEHRERIEEINREQRDLIARVEGERGSLAGKQEAALQSNQERITTLEQRLSDESEAKSEYKSKLEKSENAREQADAARSQADEKAATVFEAAKALEVKLEGARVTCENYDKELTRMGEERDALRAELAQLRERAGESDAVAQLRDQLADMQGYLQNIEEKSGSVNAETLESLVDRMSERESANAVDFEDKINASLDSTLDKITKTMELATAKPIDVVVEATDVLVGKLFDYGADVMSSNMDELEIEETKTKSNIGGSLEALRALRSGQKITHDEPDPADAVADVLDGALDDDPALADTQTTAAKAEHHGSSAENEEVSKSAKKKVSASMERLKAVRKGEENE